MKVNITPRLPTQTKTFASYSNAEKALWDLLLMLKEEKDSLPTSACRTPEVIEAYLGYKQIRDTIARLEEEKERYRKVLYKTLVERFVGRVDTPLGSFTMSAFVREEKDLDYLREVAPEAFTTVPDRLQVNVK
mgnify:CR=1 FL=1